MVYRWAVVVGEWGGDGFCEWAGGFAGSLAGCGVVSGAGRGVGAAEHDAGDSVCGGGFAGVFAAVALWAAGVFGVAVQHPSHGFGAGAAGSADCCRINPSVN